MCPMRGKETKRVIILITSLPCVHAQDYGVSWAVYHTCTTDQVLLRARQTYSSCYVTSAVSMESSQFPKTLSICRGYISTRNVLHAHTHTWRVYCVLLFSALLLRPSLASWLSALLGLDSIFVNLSINWRSRSNLKSSLDSFIFL